MIYSYSSISTFRQCPKKFSFQYIERLKIPSKESIEMYTGRKVHESLEHIYREKENGKKWTLQELLDDFDNRFDQEFDKNSIVVSNKGEGHFKEWGKKCLQQYYEKNQPFDDGQTIGLEKPILFQLGDKGPKLRGVIDRLVLQDGAHLQIHDYKTHARLPMEQWFDTNEQLPLYQIWAQQNFPRMESIKLVWHFVGLNKTMTPEFSEQHVQNVGDSIAQQAKRIEKTNHFAPQKGSHCSYCAFKPHCPAFNQETKRTLFDFA